MNDTSRLLTVKVKFETGGVGGGGNYYSFTNSQAATIQLESSARYFPQIMRYVRAGAIRYAATSASPNQLDTVAFENTNGRHAVVSHATSAQTISVVGLPAGTYGITYTTASSFLTSLPDQTIAAGQAVTFAMPAAGYVTVYGKGASTVCTPTTWEPAAANRCGTFTQTSNCGTTRTTTGSLSCGAGQTCTNNACTNTVCTPTTWEPAAASRCGSFTQTSNCGTTRTTTGSLSCAAGQTCVGNFCATVGGTQASGSSTFAANLPAGMRLVADTSFENYVDGTNNADGIVVINWVQNTIESASTFGVRGVPSSGGEGTRALRTWFPGNHAGEGVGPATLMVGGLNSRAHYMVVRMRYSPNYVLHTNGEKMFYPVGPPLATGGNGAAYAASMNVGGSGHILGYDAPIETSPPMGPLSAANVIPIGRWFTVEFFAEMNTPGQSDGTLQVWVDGVRVVNKQGVMLSNSATQQLFDRGRRDFTRGGGISGILTPPEGQWVEVDRLAFYAR